ncbi:glutathione peroxidase [Halanaerobium saccharolyticum]|uniref:Glutathione peroxidase n=1 Tax=Halanaerobium saccharolyticum TaxID=43595 RepID=A0A4R7YYE8_9FIRM|nr:glutathione peroxidase [Halanaerobium saccharolyticum]RAK06651.1 glutathione peroxidase [Halanaerobium saccharolyticum]TDW01190.1 glutathione peroxidase [Halanaerobium saccharolyticum]TDX51454.1 glutathione peroxidase [Halanaerobium saccharolyticum]
MSVYDFKANDIKGEEINLSDYKGKVLMIVNTASECGLTPQFEGLEELYQEYGDQGFEILGFPCNQFANQDSGTNEEIKEFCQLNYGVSFKMFEKIKVNGNDAHPLFKFLKKETGSLLGGIIKWNFTKFLIDREGNVVNRYAPTTEPTKTRADIEELL